jgi:DNA polymerase-3 subunit epsilon
MLETIGWFVFLAVFVALGWSRGRPKAKTAKSSAPKPSAPSVSARPAPVLPAFVHTNQAPALHKTNAWWLPALATREWLLPFVPQGVLALPALSSIEDLTPLNLEPLSKLLRALIREARKAGEPYASLLQGLYGTAQLTALVAAWGPDASGLAQFVSKEDFKGVRPDYAGHGHEQLPALLKTDIKWLTEAYGTPPVHLGMPQVWAGVFENAISRRVRTKFNRSNAFLTSVGLPATSFDAWLASPAPHKAPASPALQAAWAATSQPFVVADLETTGLNREQDEVLEFGAVLVDPSGAVLSEFSALVRVEGQVPAFVTEITGITQAMAYTKGKPLPQALSAFLEFIGEHPVFFHNASFDKGFLGHAQARTRLPFSNPVHDTLAMARATWPGLSSHKLGVLAEYVGASPPTHRALSDVKATLAVLLAAREDTFLPQVSAA